jgi:hypothetical protein
VQYQVPGLREPVEGDCEVRLAEVIICLYGEASASSPPQSESSTQNLPGLKKVEEDRFLRQRMASVVFA